MKLIELYIDENLQDESGTSAIALVDRPAIEEGFFTFKKEPKLFNITLGSQKGAGFKPFNTDKQILAGALMIPDLEIYRNDDGKEYRVFFPKSEIEKIVLKFANKNLNNAINEMHDANKRVEGVLFQHFIITRELGVNPPLGQEHLPDGTWFGFIKVKDKNIWDNFIKTGIYTGYSVEGKYYEREVQEITEEEAEFISKVNIFN